MLTLKHQLKSELLQAEIAYKTIVRKDGTEYQQAYDTETGHNVADPKRKNNSNVENNKKKSSSSSSNNQTDEKQTNKNNKIDNNVKNNSTSQDNKQLDADSIIKEAEAMFGEMGKNYALLDAKGKDMVREAILNIDPNNKAEQLTRGVSKDFHDNFIATMKTVHQTLASEDLSAIETSLKNVAQKVKEGVTNPNTKQKIAMALAVAAASTAVAMVGQVAIGYALGWGAGQITTSLASSGALRLLITTLAKAGINISASQLASVLGGAKLFTEVGSYVHYAFGFFNAVGVASYSLGSIYNFAGGVADEAQADLKAFQENAIALVKDEFNAVMGATQK